MKRADFTMNLGKLIEKAMDSLSPIEMVGALEIAKLSLLNMKMNEVQEQNSKIQNIEVWN